MILRLFDFFQRRRRLCAALLTALIGLLLVMVASLRYNENIYDFLPLSGNDQKAITLYQDISGGQRIVAMISARKEEGGTRNEEGGNPDRLAEAVDTFTTRLLQGEGRRHISEVSSQVDFEQVAGITQFIYQNMPLMLSDSDYVRMERQLATADYVDQQLAHDVEMIMMPATGFFTSSIASDPLGLFSPVLDRLQQKQRQMPFEIDNGYVFTSGQQYAIALLTSPYGAMESAQNAELVGYVDSIAQQTMQQLPDVEVALTGSPVIAVGNASQIKADSVWAISIAVTLIILLLMFSFRNIRGLLLVGVSILFGWLFAMALIAAVRSDVSLIVLGIGSIIIGIAVNYPLHFVLHTDHGGTAREVLKDMVAPLLIGNITTVGAFASLIPLDAPALRDLGLFAAFMLIGTILFVLVFLPHLVKQRRHEGEERLFFGRLAEMTPDRHRWLLGVIAVLTLVFGYFSLGTSFDANMHHINYMTPQQERLLADLNASVGLNDTANVYLVSEGATWDEALTERRRMAPVLDSLAGKGCLQQFTDATTFIAPTAEQQHRIQMWNDFWSRHRENVLRLLADNASKYGFSSDAFDDFKQIVSGHYEPQPFSHFEPIRSVLLNNSFSESTGCCSVVDVISVPNNAAIPQLEAALNKSVGEHGYAFDFVGMNSAVARSLSDDFNYIGFACGLIVFVFLWLSFGRLELSLLAFLPMALGWIWILGIMYLCDMQFNIVNVILATFIFGQGDDYTIFMTDGLINEYAYRKRLLPSYKNSIVVSALIMFIGMGSLIVARHPALHSLAEVTIVGMVTVVLMAWVVPPLVFGWLVRTEGRNRRFPVTIEQLIRIIYCAAAYLTELAYGSLLGLVGKFIPHHNVKFSNWLHRVVQRTMYVNITHIWGVRPVLRNEHGEDFSHGSIIISNHQSMLDPIYILAFHPHILITMGGHVWRNPIVHPMLRMAGFINMDQPIEQLQQQIGEAVNRGFNVVMFPEGKRTDGTIERFHRGAFHLAQQIKCDLLPVYIHGTGDVMPKDSGLAARGRIDVEIGRRIPANEVAKMGDSYQELTRRMHQQYLDHYEELRREIEDTHYFHHQLIYKYTYKGIAIERETRRLLKQYDDFSQWIDGFRPADANCRAVSIIDARHGQFSLMMALVHPELEVYSYAFDADDAALAAACEPLPKNLHISYAASREEALSAAAGTEIIWAPHL